LSKKILLITSLLIANLISTNLYSKELHKSSKIYKVHLYQNQAKIYRKTNIQLKKGHNKIIIKELPEVLYDWSVRAMLPKMYKGKILSIAVEKKALIKKREKKVQTIESKINALKDKDQILLDELSSLNYQKKFINSILNFTKETATTELKTRIPQVAIWDKTLVYATKKIKKIQSKKREVEKKRKELGKKVQLLEYKLSQLVGYKYFKSYQKLNKAQIQNQKSLSIQTFSNLNEEYAIKKRFLQSNQGKLNIEKRIFLNIFSSKDKKVELNFTYFVPNTYWLMRYDIRADEKNKKINMIIHGKIYQKSGEDWKNVELTLSTGSPISSISPPTLSYWFLDIKKQNRYPNKSNYDKRIRKKYSKKFESGAPISKNDAIPQSSIKQKFSSFEINFPLKQTILSSNKYQKKYVKEFKLKGKDNLEFYYQVIPEKSNKAYLRVKTKNITSIPWLAGKAQLFLNKEFMGKTFISYTPINKKRDLVLGIEKRIEVKKRLLKKYENKSGIFGGNRQIRYSYQVTVLNQMDKKCKISLKDILPISRNSKIKVEIENLNFPYIKNKKTINSTEYKAGIKKWNFLLKPSMTRKINYDIVVTFNKELKINGLK